MFTEMKSAGLSSICQGTRGEKGSALRAILSVLPLPAPAAPAAGAVAAGAVVAAAVAAAVAPPAGAAVVGALVAAPAGAVVGRAAAVVGVGAAPQAASSELTIPPALSDAIPRSRWRRDRRCCALGRSVTSGTATSSSLKAGRDCDLRTGASIVAR